MLGTSFWRCLAIPGLAAVAGARTGHEPSGYRMEDYRAPTPATLPGATVLTTEAAHDLWANHQAAFIDVLPRPPRPPDCPPAPSGGRSHDPIFPAVSGCRTPATAPWPRSCSNISQRGLAQASAGDHGRMLVFYCLRDCWMSWNAAKRAMTLGYTHVGWYPDGTDGWQAHGFPLEPREPQAQPSATRVITPVPAGSGAPARTAAARSCPEPRRRSSAPAGGPGRPPPPRSLSASAAAPPPRPRQTRPAQSRPANPGCPDSDCSARSFSLSRRTCSASSFCRLPNRSRPAMTLSRSSVQHAEQPNQQQRQLGLFALTRVLREVMDQASAPDRSAPAAAPRVCTRSATAGSSFHPVCDGSTAGPDQTEAMRKLRHLDLLARPVRIAAARRCAQRGHRQPAARRPEQAGSCQVHRGGKPGRAPGRRQRWRPPVNRIVAPATTASDSQSTSRYSANRISSTA